MRKGKKAAKKTAKKTIALSTKNVPLRVNPAELRAIWYAVGRTIASLEDDINLESPDELEELAAHIRLEDRVRELYVRHFGPVETPPAEEA